MPRIPYQSVPHVHIGFSLLPALGPARRGAVHRETHCGLLLVDVWQSEIPCLISEHVLVAVDVRWVTMLVLTPPLKLMLQALPPPGRPIACLSPRP